MKLSVLLVAVSLSLVACTGARPKVPERSDITGRLGQEFAVRPPVRVIELPMSLFLSKPFNSPVPEEIASKKLSIDNSLGVLVIDDLLVMFEEQGIPVSFNWEQTTATEGVTVQTREEFGKQQLPFRSFDGTLNDLLHKLEVSLNIASWWDRTSLFLANEQRYVVNIPQNEDVAGALEEELGNLGAANIASSIYAGQMVYTSSTRLNREVIQPFLERFSLNVSEVTMQVAVVSVTMTEASRRGFNWGNFSSAISSDIEAPVDLLSSAIGPGSLAVNNFREGFKIFGNDFDISVNGVIDYLASFGVTTTEQNVELRTISGQTVTIQDTRADPYIESITSSTTTGTATNTSSGVEFGSIDTGLTLDITPRFDGMSGLVTVEIGFVQDALIRIANLAEEAGITSTTPLLRPVTTSRQFDDLVRVPAGETVVVGGLVTTNSQETLNSVPFGQWSIAGRDRPQEANGRSVLFIILRPTVTVYTTPGMQLNPKILMATQTRRENVMDDILGDFSPADGEKLELVGKDDVEEYPVVKESVGINKLFGERGQTRGEQYITPITKKPKPTNTKSADTNIDTAVTEKVSSERSSDNSESNMSSTADVSRNKAPSVKNSKDETVNEVFVPLREPVVITPKESIRSSSVETNSDFLETPKPSATNTSPNGTGVFEEFIDTLVIE